MPFYKREADSLLIAPTFVAGPAFELREDERELHSYPVEGWHWFAGLDQAMSYFAALAGADAVRVKQRQARLYLFNHGYLAQVESALQGLPEPQRTTALIEWEYASDIERTNPLVSAVAAILGWSTEQVDLFFAEASAL